MDILRAKCICYLRIAALGIGLDIISCLATVIRIAFIRLPVISYKLCSGAISDFQCLALRTQMLITTMEIVTERNVVVMDIPCLR